MDQRDLSIAVNVGLTAAKEFTIAACSGHDTTIDDYVNTFLSIAPALAQAVVDEHKAVMAREQFPGATVLPARQVSPPTPPPSAPQPGFVPPEAQPAPTAPPVAPPDVPGVTTRPGDKPIEDAWRSFFADPNRWWDNRSGKRSERAPDFRHKDTGQGLWIKDRRNPSWVLDGLRQMGYVQ